MFVTFRGGRAGDRWANTRKVLAPKCVSEVFHSYPNHVAKVHTQKSARDCCSYMRDTICAVREKRINSLCGGRGRGKKHQKKQRHSRLISVIGACERHCDVALHKPVSAGMDHSELVVTRFFYFFLVPRMCYNNTFHYSCRIVRKLAHTIVTTKSTELCNTRGTKPSHSTHGTARAAS